MKSLSLSLLPLTLMLALLATTAPALANASGPRAEASAFYNGGDYNAAYKRYLKLAKSGDAFAQYRVSYMELTGQGTRADVIDALAWAVVAAEHDIEELRDYRDAVAAMVPAKQRKKAQSKADYFVRRWGQEDDSGGASRSRSSGSDCTGSRLSSYCDEGSGGASVWIAWGEDRSQDPQHRTRIDELNQVIVGEAASWRQGATGR